MISWLNKNIYQYELHRPSLIRIKLYKNFETSVIFDKTYWESVIFINNNIHYHSDYGCGYLKTFNDIVDLQRHIIMMKFKFTGPNKDKSYNDLIKNSRQRPIDEPIRNRLVFSSR